MNPKSFPKDLLEQSRFLIGREPNRPKQASLRRAVSTAYYALFHLLTVEAVQLLGPNLNPVTRSRMQRWIDHGSIRSVCERFVASSLAEPLSSLIGPHCSAPMQLVARNFVRLQEARHRADYDLSRDFSRAEAELALQTSEDATTAWGTLANSEEANIFLLSFLLWKQWEKQR